MKPGTSRSSYAGQSDISGFTLIELLVVIAIIAILAVVVVLTLNPAQLLQQSRDANRLSDMATLASALNLYVIDQTGGSSFSLGNSLNTEISVYDPNGSSTCGSLGLSVWNASSGQAWQCATATSSRLVNGYGWIPVNFSNISSGAPIGSLPVDPVNQTSTGLFYAYNTNGSQFEVTANLESQKYKTQYGNTPQTSLFPEVISGGTPTVSALYNPSGLVGYWPLDEGSGSSTIDQSGNGNNGTWSGGAVGTNGYYSAGKVGKWAGMFDGSSTNIDAGNNSSLNITATITLAVWVNQTSWNNYPFPISKGYAGIGYSLQIRNDNSIWFEMDDTSGTRHYYNPTSLFIPNGTWTFVAATYDGSIERIYINGQQDGSGLSGTFTTGTSTNHVYIGGKPPGYPYGPLNGSLDDVRIYNRALSSAEIMALYDAER